MQQQAACFAFLYQITDCIRLCTPERRIQQGIFGPSTTSASTKLVCKIKRRELSPVASYPQFALRNINAGLTVIGADREDRQRGKRQGTNQNAPA